MIGGAQKLRRCLDSNRLDLISIAQSWWLRIVTPIIRWNQELQYLFPILQIVKRLMSPRKMTPFCLMPCNFKQVCLLPYIDLYDVDLYPLLIQSIEVFNDLITQRRNEIPIQSKVYPLIIDIIIIYLPDLAY